MHRESLGTRQQNIESLGSRLGDESFVRQENGTGENRKKKDGKGKTVVGKRKINGEKRENGEGQGM